MNNVSAGHNVPNRHMTELEKNSLGTEAPGRDFRRNAAENHFQYKGRRSEETELE